jgi:uncharacterized membrane protein
MVGGRVVETGGVVMIGPEEVVVVGVVRSGVAGVVAVVVVVPSG